MNYLLVCNVGTLLDNFVNMGDRINANVCKSLEESLMSPLGFKIPIMDSRLIEQYDGVFERGNIREAPYLLDSFLQHQLCISDSEMPVVATDTLYLTALARSLKLDLLQDLHDSSSSAMKRPDGIVMKNGALLIKLEAKDAAVKLDVARRELVDKLAKDAVMLFPKGERSVVGIVTSPTVIKLYLISQAADGNFTTNNTPKVYQVDDMPDRVEFLQDIFRIGKWIASVEEPNQTFHLIPNKIVKTPNGHTVFWCSDGLKKTYNILKTSDEALNRIATVLGFDLPHIEKGTRETQNVFLIKSVGETLPNALRKYKTPEERTVFKALVKSQVSLGLQELHGKGFAHCDLHVGNVFVKDTWVFLDDLEYLSPKDGPPAKKEYNFELWSGMKAIDVDVKQFEIFVSDLISL